METTTTSEDAQDVEAPVQEVTLAVTIPENSAAGEKLTVQGPGNTFVQFITPEHVVPGDTVHVTVADSMPEAGNAQEQVSDSSANGGTNYKSVAAVTTGVVVSAIVIGPIITGALVVGIVVCAAQRKNAQASAPTPPTAAEDMEAGGPTNDSVAEQKVQETAEPQTREEKIAAAFVKTAEYIADKWCAIDDRLGISSSTLKAIATVQEMDERNKVSETVVTGIKNFDEKYQVTETAGTVVNNTVTKVKELDESCKLTENVTLAGSNLALCVTDFERRYDITTRITTALIFTMTSLSEALTVYMNRITYGSDGGNGPPAANAAPLSADTPLASAPEETTPTAAEALALEALPEPVSAV